MPAKLGRTAYVHLVSALAVGCAPVVASSGVMTHAALAPSSSSSTVTLSATLDPSGAEEIGIVEAHGPAATFAQVAAEFRARVAALGGNFGRIDSFATRHELRTETRTYECGSYETQMQLQSSTTTGPDGSPVVTSEMVPVTVYVSKTCTDEQQVEHATLTLVGRAFRTPKESP